MIIWFILGLILIGMGILYQNESYIKWETRFVNDLKGVKTQIANRTIKARKIGGIFLVVLGIATIATILFSLLILSKF